MAENISGVRPFVMTLKIAANTTVKAAIIEIRIPIDRMQKRIGMGMIANIADTRARNTRAVCLILRTE
jgi:hypothetical protein